MAKKPAPKKKAVSAKTASAKPAAVKSASPVAKKNALAKATTKAAVKPVGKKAVAKPAVKSAAKPTPVKAVKSAAKASAPIAAPQPALMTKKGKAAPLEEVEEEIKPAAKNQTVVSMLETDSGVEEPAKAEKASKIKPVKIEKGNLADEKAKWAELHKKYGKEKALQYKMSEKFPNMVPMQHKVLGWGFILTNENDRLEVLFETGIRMLISNYKS